MPGKRYTIVINFNLFGGEKTMDRYWELTVILSNKQNQEVLSDYLLNLKLANRSRYSITYYKQFLVNFFIEMEDSFSSLTSERILGWFQQNKSNLKESSYKKYLTILSSFYNFCLQESLIDRSPVKKRWFPRLPKPIPKYLEKEEVAKLRQVSECSSLRNQAIVEFMLTSGCRVGEVHRLNIEDVDIENRTARVIGKGKKIRHVHFSEKSAMLIERYLEFNKQEGSVPLFMTLKGNKNRLSIPGIQAILYKIGVKAGLKRKLHPHQLRHTFATELLTKGAELSFISDELGHADLNTTQIYARVPNKLIISQYRKFMG
jgi:site-specific recombinase XerD